MFSRVVELHLLARSLNYIENVKLFLLEQGCWSWINKQVLTLQRSKREPKIVCNKILQILIDIKNYLMISQYEHQSIKSAKTGRKIDLGKRTII